MRQDKKKMATTPERKKRKDTLQNENTHWNRKHRLIKKELLFFFQEDLRCILKGIRERVNDDGESIILKLPRLDEKGGNKRMAENNGYAEVRKVWKKRGFSINRKTYLEKK